MMIKNKFKLLCLLPLSLVAVTTPIILSSCSINGLGNIDQNDIIQDDDFNSDSNNDFLNEHLEKAVDENKPIKNQSDVENELIFPQIKNIFLKEKSINKNTSTSDQIGSKYEVTEEFKAMLQSGILSKMYKANNNGALANISLLVDNNTSIRIHDKAISIDNVYGKNNEECTTLYISPKLITELEITKLWNTIERNKNNDTDFMDLYNEFIASYIFNDIKSMPVPSKNANVGLFGFYYTFIKIDSDGNRTEILSFAPLKKSNNKYMYSYYLSKTN